MTGDRSDQKRARYTTSWGRLVPGIVLYLSGAAADIYMTMAGMGNDLALEGNPLLRWAMARFGVEAGLGSEKLLILVLTVVLAGYGERCIRRQDPWIWKVPMTKWVRAWMRRKDRSWIAFIPLYATGLAQILAAASWLTVP
jgi:hypothetical protein